MGADRRFLLLINPDSRKGEASVSAVRTLFEKMGHPPVNDEDFTVAEFGAAIRRYAQEIDVVAVGGGDGSMNAALADILEAKLAMAVIPLGTSNNLARNLGIPFDLEAACALIRDGIQRRIDLGKVNDFFFLNVAGMGLSIEVNRTVHHRFKRYFGMLAYVATAFRVLKRYRPFRAEIVSDSGEICLRALQISVCNGQHFGSGLKIAHDAVIDDGELDLVSIPIERWWKIPRLARAFRTGIFGPEDSTFVCRGGTFTIRTSRPIAVDTDGEIRTKTPARFSIVPSALSVLVPAGETSDA